MSESFAHVHNGVNDNAGENIAGTNISSVAVKATSRLHMGFFDLNGDLGRKFGSIGVSLDQPAFSLEVYPADTFTAEAADTIDRRHAGTAIKRAVDVSSKLVNALRLSHGMSARHGLHIRLDQVIPEHSGLGSGTQLSLAIGTAISRLYGLDISIEELATLTQRGARSGIGLGTFTRGGVIVDGGRGANTVIPPVIAHADFPEVWRIVLIFDHADTGMHGKQESDAFSSLGKVSSPVAAGVCRNVLMQALPALAERDLQSFGDAIRQLQAATGDYFAPVQGGRYASKRVASVLEWLESEGVGCLGQSSWGPTSFAIVGNADEAAFLLQRVKEKFKDQQGLEFVLCQGYNQGATIHEFRA